MAKPWNIFWSIIRWNTSYLARNGILSRAKNLYLAKGLKRKINFNLEELKKLHGIGDYVSSAICAILFDQNCTVIGSNIKKIVTGAQPKKNKPNLEKNIKYIATHLHQSDNGSYCQTLMDMATLICTNKTPNCLACPVKMNVNMKEKELKTEKN